MPELRGKKARHKLEQLDVLGALDRLAELADPESGGSKRMRLERARLRTVQTVAISVVIAVSILCVVAFVMGMLREKWNSTPPVPAFNQPVAQAASDQTGTQALPPPVAQVPVPAAEQHAALALTKQMLKWEHATMAKNIAQLRPSSAGGCYLMTEAGWNYRHITQLSATGESVAECDIEIKSLDSQYAFLDFDSEGCYYFRDLSKLNKFDMSGTQLWSIDRPVSTGCLFPLADGGLLTLGGTPRSMSGSADKPQPGSPTCTISRLNSDGTARWTYTDQRMSSLALGPDGSVYFYSCPQAFDARLGNDAPQREQAQLCCLSSRGKLKWRMPLAQPEYEATQFAMTPGGDVLLAHPRSAEGDGELLLIDSASGKRLRSYPVFAIYHVVSAADGTVYVIGNYGNSFYALNAKFELLWQQDLSAAAGPPLVFPDSTVCLCDRFTLRGFTSSGRPLYDLALSEADCDYREYSAVPITGPGGVVLVPRGGKLLAYEHRDWNAK